MGREEQIEEREVVLASIFPDEITDISETSYRVSIALDIPGQEPEDEEDRPTILLTVSYPEAYPDVAPDLELSFPQPPVPRPSNITLPDDKSHLLGELETTIEESLGLAMISSLVFALKESTESLVASRLAEVQAVHDRAAAQEEERENAKFYGEKVTRERFLDWRQKFMDEMQRKVEEDKKLEEEGAAGKARGAVAARAKEDKKLTGKELWERGLVGKVDEDLDVPEELITAALSRETLAEKE